MSNKYSKTTLWPGGLGPLMSSPATGAPAPLAAPACGLSVPAGCRKDLTHCSCQALGERQAGALPSPMTQEPVPPAEVVSCHQAWSPHSKSSSNWCSETGPSPQAWVSRLGELVFPMKYLSKKKKKLNMACQGELSVSIFFSPSPFFGEWLFGYRQEASVFCKNGKKERQRKDPPTTPHLPWEIFEE